MKVQEVIETISNDCSIGYELEKSCDRLMSGNLQMEVRGIVTTFMATVEVIRQTVACGANMIVTHEPTFYTSLDETDWLLQDPVYITKKRLIDDNEISIWRFHDHMHMAPTDRIYDGLLKEIGWEDKVIKNQMSHYSYEIAETTLADLAGFFKGKFSMPVVRIVGDPSMKCKRVGILAGGGSLGLGREQMPMELINELNLDVVICGEITEWTLCSYVNDAQMLGINKAILILGHERTEEWGMKHMAQWLKPLVGGIPVTFIDAKEPFRYL